MARRRYNNYEPQIVDPGVIDFGAIQMYNPEDTARLVQVGQNMQQRWDASQANIAKYLEDVGAAKMRDVDSPIALQRLNQNLEDIYSTVNKDYQGDFGRAYNEITRNLSKSKGIMHQAQKAYEEEQKYVPLISKLAAEKKLIFAPNAQGEYVDPRTKSVFNEKGEYVGGIDYSNIRERSDYDKTVEDAIVRGIDKTAIESGLINSKTAGYLMQLQQSGLAALTPDKIDQIAEEYAPIFEAKTTYGIDPDKPKISSKEYVKDAIYRLAGSKTGRQYMADRNYDPNGGKSNDDAPSDASVVYEGGLVANPKGFTSQSFFKNSPNARHFISRQSNEPLKEVTPSVEDYSKGKITLEQLQAYTIEKKLRDSDEELSTLFKAGSKTDDAIAKQYGYESIEDFRKASITKDLNTVDTRVSNAIAERNYAATQYSNKLKEKAGDFINNSGMDLDYNVMFYQPDFTQEKVSTQYNNWNSNIKNDFTIPGQFTYLDGDLKDKSSDDINEIYKKKKADFGVMGVGGNDSTGLIWKVKNPDGTISNAKWNTGYKKQAGYIRNILRNPELINVLNSSALEISNGNIKGVYPDVSNSIDYKVQKYKLKAEPFVQDPNLYYIKNENGYIQIDYEDGVPKFINTVSSPDSATRVPKNLMFDVINSLP